MRKMVPPSLLPSFSLIGVTLLIFILPLSVTRLDVVLLS